MGECETGRGDGCQNGGQRVNYSDDVNYLVNQYALGIRRFQRAFNYVMAALLLASLVPLLDA